MSNNPTLKPTIAAWQLVDRFDEPAAEHRILTDTEYMRLRAALSDVLTQRGSQQPERAPFRFVPLSRPKPAVKGAQAHYDAAQLAWCEAFMAQSGHWPRMDEFEAGRQSFYRAAKLSLITYDARDTRTLWRGLRQFKE